MRYPADPAAAFFLPDTFLDPFGNATTVSYRHAHPLLLERVTDAAGTETGVLAFDFRLLRPREVRDANGNVSEVSYDLLGEVSGLALRGKGAEADDLQGFRPDLDQAEIDAYLLDPVANGPALLGNATARFVYDVSRVPAASATIQRETHAAEAAAAGVPSRLRHQLAYTDGLGRVALTKAEAEPGRALVATASGDGFAVTEVDTGNEPRWVGSGRTVRNNKGDPVMRFEPYFAASPGHEDAAALAETGVSPVLGYDPLGRLVRTDFPDGTFSRTRFDAWSRLSFDQNDTVLASAWHAARIGGKLGPVEQAAAQRSAVHDDTPEAGHLDPLGRVVHAVSHDRWRDPATAAVVDRFPTGDTVLDVEGRQLALLDARGNAVQRQSFDLAGVAAATVSMDGGARWLLDDVAGRPLYGWDAMGNRFHTAYDVLHRPVWHQVLEAGAAAPRVFERCVYGSDPALNQVGRLVSHFDGAGLVTHDAYDFKGNVLRSSRRFTVGTAEPDWSDPAAVPLRPESYATQASFDALNRTTRATTPDGSVTTNRHGVANLLTGVEVAAPGGPAVPFVLAVDHDARGQRLRVEHGNGTAALFTYDPLTFRPRRVQTLRTADGAVLQDLSYCYDPVGNVLTVQDAAQQARFFAGTVVEPRADFTYDALYRLRSATGRELIGLGGAADQFDADRTGRAHPADGTALRRYRQRYEYDVAGNMVAMRHAAGAGPFTEQWTRLFTPDAASNRLAASQVGTVAEGYGHDAHGNLVAAPGLAGLAWDTANRLVSVDLAGGGTASYGYDAGGTRVRKVVRRLGGMVEERLYVGALEVFTRSLGGTVALRRETLHVMDGGRRLAMVETRTAGNDGSAPRTVRFQHANLVGTAVLELDEAARVLSYEEYTPFGSTSFQAVDGSLDAPAKRFRFTGKERDEETGLYYHGARYYAPWLARWASPDPAGTADGPNLYCYCKNHPVGSHDPTGMWEVDWRTAAVVAAVVVVGIGVTIATGGLAAPIAAAVAGATTGTLGATGAAILGGAAAGAVVGAIGGAAVGAAGEFARQAVGDEPFDAGAIVREGAKGLVMGFVGGAITGGLSASLLRAVGATATGARLVQTLRTMNGQKTAGTELARLGRDATVNGVSGATGGAASEAVRQKLSHEPPDAGRVLGAGALGLGLGVAVPTLRFARGALAPGRITSLSADADIGANAYEAGTLRRSIPPGTQIYDSHGLPGQMEMPGSPYSMPVGRLAPTVGRNPANEVILRACSVGADEAAVRSLAEATGRNVTAYDVPILKASPTLAPTTAIQVPGFKGWFETSATSVRFSPDTLPSVQVQGAAVTSGAVSGSLMLLRLQL